jgi:hypothetical protein
MFGTDPASYPSRGEIRRRIDGRMNPENNVAEACIPEVPVKKSMVSPEKKQIIRSNQDGVSTGNSNMNII